MSIGKLIQTTGYRIIGWNPITAKLMERHLKARARTVVLLDGDLDGSSDERISFFVKGQPSLDANLIRGGADRASVAIVSLLTDGATGLTASSVKRLNPGCRLTAVAIEVENVDRLGETGAYVLCAVQKMAETISREIGERSAIAFGKGPVINHLRTIAKARTVFDNGNPAVDADLIGAQVANHSVVIIEPRDDEHGWLVVASVRAQAPNAYIIAVLEHEENRSHLETAGANLVLCPTTVIVQ